MFEGLFGRKPSPLVESAFDDISRMLDRGASMFDIALASLLDNEPLEEDLDSLDDQIDEGERMVRRSILQHLSFDPQHDLVPSLILASMVQDAERIGDFARGLGELVPLARSPRSGPFRDRLRQLADQLRPQFGRCEEAFRNDDSDRASEVIGLHVTIKADLDVLMRDVAASDLSADMAVVYAVTARILRRVSAHLSNIASSVVQPYDRIRHGDEEA